MFYKALLISILIHLLLLSLPGSILPSLTERTKTGSSPDQQVEYRKITLVELPPPPVLSNGEPSADPQGNSRLNLSEKPAKQPVSLDRLPTAHVALPSPPVPVPAKQPPFSTGSEPEPAGSPFVVSPPVQPAEPRPNSSGQDRMMDGPFPLEAAAEVEAETSVENGLGQAEKLIPRGDFPGAKTQDATAAGADVPLNSGEIEPSTGFAHTFVHDLDGSSINGEKMTLPTTSESDSAPSLVKVFHTDPVYPRLARRRGWEGTVYLIARIAPEGEVIATAVTQSSGYELLDQAAQEAVGQWRYAWSEEETETAEEATITVKIRFQLED